jgi:hypothetical protein
MVSRRDVPPDPASDVGGPARRRGRPPGVTTRAVWSDDAGGSGVTTWAVWSDDAGGPADPTRAVPGVTTWAARPDDATGPAVTSWAAPVRVAGRAGAPGLSGVSAAGGSGVRAGVRQTFTPKSWAMPTRPEA